MGSIHYLIICPKVVRNDAQFTKKSNSCLISKSFKDIKENFND